MGHITVIEIDHDRIKDGPSHRQLVALYGSGGKTGEEIAKGFTVVASWRRGMNPDLTSRWLDFKKKVMRR